MNTVNVKISARIYKDDERVFGPGTATLLRYINEMHSIRTAAKAMFMAYSKAWEVIRRAEKSLGFPLLERTRGGKNGGGAVLTEKGLLLLQSYDDYCKEIADFSAKYSDTMINLINNAREKTET